MTETPAPLPEDFVVRYGYLRLCIPTGALLDELAELGTRPIHRAGWCPFSDPWTFGDADDVRRATLDDIIEKLNGSTPQDWDVPLAIIHEKDGVRSLLGRADLFHDADFDADIAETGSWITMEAQGRGTGTVVRKMLIAVAFDHLGFRRVATSIREDNAPSLGVVRKLNYEEVSRRPHQFHDGQAELIHFELHRKHWTRNPMRIEPRVQGARELRVWLSR